MPSILITGAYGLLGSSLAPFLQSKGHTVFRHSRKQPQLRAELTDTRQTTAMLDTLRPEIIINLAGLTDVDKCETHPHQAYLANVRVVENIAAWIRQSSAPCHFIQISTDHVYDGQGPHREDHTALTNYYAFSKYAGELAAAAVSASTLRTNFFGRSRCDGRQSFTDWLYRSLVGGDQIEVFEDVAFSPLSLYTLSEMIELAVQRRPVGVYNLGSRDGVSKADFAFAFADMMHLRTSGMKRTTSDKARLTRAYRPKDMRMDCARYELTMNLRMPSLDEEMKKIERQYREQI
jgi:dTDP-4-dehydrorhamnose reductase